MKKRSTSRKAKRTTSKSNPVKAALAATAVQNRAAARTKKDAISRAVAVVTHRPTTTKRTSTARRPEPVLRRESPERQAQNLPPALVNFQPKNIALMYRPNTPDAIKQAKELAMWLTDQGFKIYAAPSQTLVRGTWKVTPRNLDEIDWVIVLGGDGTYLKAVHMLQGRQTPILGVNMGSLGFLTETRVEDLYKMILFTLHKRMEFRPRSMLLVTVRRHSQVVATHVALNDTVLERGSSTHLTNIAVYNERNLVGEIKADALIIASPTGSTAYNLAAGGPILHPDVRALVLTPVCPHALTTRPLIFPDDQELNFKVLSETNPVVLTVDGTNCGQITIDDEITIVRNPLDHYVIRRPSHNYFQLLREKLKFGERD